MKVRKRWIFSVYNTIDIYPKDLIQVDGLKGLRY